MEIGLDGRAWAHEGPAGFLRAPGIMPPHSPMYTRGRSFHELGVISRTVSMIAFWTLGARWPPLAVTRPGRGRSFGGYGPTGRKQTYDDLPIRVELPVMENAPRMAAIGEIEALYPAENKRLQPSLFAKM
jgi:hypothetical protein